ncbi:MAG TPA: hypothetical protein VJY39_09805 [Acidisphaera sp.]|nr:hypothetical protein [Acidisphaera sp.]
MRRTRSGARCCSKLARKIDPDPSVARDAANQRQQAVSRLDENDQLQRASHTPRDMAAPFHVRTHGYGREWTEPKSWSAEALTQNDERRRNIGYRLLMEACERRGVRKHVVFDLLDNRKRELHPSVPLPRPKNDETNYERGHRRKAAADALLRATDADAPTAARAIAKMLELLS